MRKKGRNTELVRLRDEALCRRYYYWTEVRRLRFDDTLKILSLKEFFISEETICNIVRKLSNNIIQEQSIAPHKDKFPHLTHKQLALFSDDANLPIAQIHRDSRTGS